MRLAAMLARRNNNQHLYCHQLISGRRNSFQHLLLISTSVFNRLQLSAGHYKIPAQQQAVDVGRILLATRS